MATNIFNPETGQTGYQVPGAPIAAGWQAGTPGAAPIPTSAPKVQTPVVSSSSAASDINNSIVPAMNQGKLDVQAGIDNAKIQADKIQQEIDKLKQAQTQKPEKTPEQQIADDPGEGMQWTYNLNTGERAGAIPMGATPPTGLTKVNPNAEMGAPAAEDPNGVVIKQLSDGSYGSFGPGGYQGPATAQDFKNAQMSTQLRSKLDQVINGTYPLTSSQQAQIRGIQDRFAQLIQDQQVANQNFTAGTTVAQNLYGLGNTVIAMGAIQTSINVGIQKIADLNSKMAEAVAGMTASFESENYKQLKDSYDSYTKAANDRQAQIDKWQEQISKAKAAQQAQIEKVDQDIRSVIDAAGKGGASPETLAKMNEMLLKHDFTGAVREGGSYLETATGIVGEYNFYKRDAIARGQTPVDFNTYQNIDANRKAKVAAAGIAVGTDMTTKQQAVFNSILDKRNKSPLIAANDRSVILKKITSELANDPTNAALQVSFIYSMIQALDTYQSAVREGEINLLAETQGLAEKIGNLPSKIEKGNPLAESKIKDYLKVANTLTGAIQTASDQKSSAYKAQAIVNGIGSQWDEYENTVKELNQTSTGDEQIQTEEAAKAKIIESGKSNPQYQAQVKAMVGDGVPYLDILKALNMQ